MGVNKSIDIVSIPEIQLDQHSGPVYRRLALAIQQKIFTGQLRCGDKLPTHRGLADTMKVAIGTISRAYSELEKMGLVQSRVGDGTFVRYKVTEGITGIEYTNSEPNPSQLIDLSRNKRISNLDDEPYKKALAAVVLSENTFSDLLDYTAEEGLLRHRKAGMKWLELSHVKCNIEQVVCTNGAQHGLLCVFLATLKAGDVVVTEHLSYPGLMALARLYRVRLIGCEMDEFGLLPLSLYRILSKQRVNALFCAPTLQNPTTTTMPLERRLEIITLSRAHNLLIIEDEAHGVLADKRPPSIQSLAPECTILLTSVSKALAPGLRVGWMTIPSPLVHRVKCAIRAANWMPTPLMLAMATFMLENGTAMVLRGQQNTEVARRKLIVSPLLDGLVFCTDVGCPHFWIEIEEPLRAANISAQLNSSKVLVSSSETFAVGRGAIPQFIRASVSGARSDEELIKSFRSIQILLGNSTA